MFVHNYHDQAFEGAFMSWYSVASLAVDERRTAPLAETSNQAGL